MVLGLTSVTTMSLSRANTSVSFACTNTDASIPAGQQQSGGTLNVLSVLLLKLTSLLQFVLNRVFVPWTLMSAMLWLSSHTSTWKQPNMANSLKLKTPPSLAPLSTAERAETRVEDVSCQLQNLRPNVLTHLGADSLDSPVRPCPVFSTCFLASRLRV